MTHFDWLDGITAFLAILAGVLALRHPLHEPDAPPPCDCSHGDQPTSAAPKDRS